MLAAKLSNYLKTHTISYRVLHHRQTNGLEQIARDLSLPLSSIIKVIPVLVKEKPTLLLLGADSTANFDLLKKKYGQVSILPETSISRAFEDCEPGAYPPFGQIYGFKIIVDKKLLLEKNVYFQAGSSRAVVQLSQNDFIYLLPRTTLRLNFSETLSQSTQQQAEPLAYEIGHYDYQFVYPVPHLPPLVKQLLTAVMTKGCSTQELVELIALDKNLNTQILQLARKAFLEQQIPGRIENMQDAIEHVFDFEQLSHLALGLTTGNLFQVEDHEPLSVKAFWRHAIYCASLARKLAEAASVEHRLVPGIAHLAGLMHNFGLLLFAHMFPPEFQLLNRWMSLNPRTPIELFERRLLGMGRASQVLARGHANLGAWLMDYWGMPEEIVTVAREHHRLNYVGRYRSYVLIVQIASQSLKKYGLGDGFYHDFRSRDLEVLQLTAKQVNQFTEEVFSTVSVFDPCSASLTH